MTTQSTERATTTTRLTGRIWPEDGVERRIRELVHDVFTPGPVIDRIFDRHPSGLQVEQFVEPGKAVIRVEAPGLDPERDIDVRVAGGVLVVGVQRTETAQEDRPSGFYTEFRYGATERAIRMPEGATGSDVTATYDNGILRIEVPVAEPPVEPVKVDVKHA